MKLKERELGKPFSLTRSFGKRIYRFISNKKLLIFGKILFLILFFAGGTMVGLVISGYFGTFDNPSQNLLDILHEMDIRNLRDIKQKTESILHENIKIPINYVKGQFSNPKKIYIDIGFDELKQIEYKRKIALIEEQIILKDSDYVPATIRYKDNQVDVKLRLKGGIDHWKGDKCSFRIKTKGDSSFLGMTTFAVHYPGARNNLNEYIFEKALEREGVLSIRYEFVEVYVNGENKGIFAIEEGFDKPLMEHNQRREGLIIKFEDQTSKEQDIKIKEYFDNDLVRNEYKNEMFFGNWFYDSNVETYNGNRVFKDPVLTNQFQQAKNLLNSFKEGELKTSEVFNVDKYAKYFAVVSVMGCRHGPHWNNIRFYYNPITSKLEPIGYDGNCGDSWSEITTQDLTLSCLNTDGDCPDNPKWFDLIMRDEVFYEKYIQELERMIEPSYLDDLFLELDPEIKKNINIIHKDNPMYYFPREIFYNNQKQIRMDLNPETSLNAYVKKRTPNKIILSVTNIQNYPIEIISLSSNNSELKPIKNILQPRQEDLVYQEFEFYGNIEGDLKLNYKLFGTNRTKIQFVYPWPYLEDVEPLDIKEDVVIEPGTTINLIEKSIMFSSNIILNGSKEKPIKIISTDGTGSFVVIGGKAILNNVIFNNLTNPKKENWELTGAINFYESEIEFNNVVIENINAEDGLNIVSSNFIINNLTIKNSLSDCLDIDFGKGIIKNLYFINCGNDGLDFSGSLVNLTDITILNTVDKGISIGEKSEIMLKGFEINNANIGIASKDLSEVIIDDGRILNTNYSIAVYEKKSEYGSALLIATNIESDNYIVEVDSILSINNLEIKDKEDKVYEKLYAI